MPFFPYNSRRLVFFDRGGNWVQVWLNGLPVSSSWLVAELEGSDSGYLPMGTGQNWSEQRPQVSWFPQPKVLAIGPQGLLSKCLLFQVLISSYLYRWVKICARSFRISLGLPTLSLVSGVQLQQDPGEPSGWTASANERESETKLGARSEVYFCMAPLYP